MTVGGSLVQDFLFYSTVANFFLHQKIGNDYSKAGLKVRKIWHITLGALSPFMPGFGLV